VCAAQIWVNLPGRHKLTQPRIQLLGENVDGVGLGAIPVHSGDGYQVRYEMV
jgi:redox-sensitive bicupin YhaK (pirin superfamily)